jgi:hypothetical protein
LLLCDFGFVISHGAWISYEIDSDRSPGFREETMVRTASVLVLAASFLLVSCTGEGEGPPMIPGDFEHGTLVGESDGGVACLSCHVQAHISAMTTPGGYHHLLNNDDPASPVFTGAPGDASDSKRNCLMCHVDHDVFNPSLNANSPGRAFNLRISPFTAASTAPSTFTNADCVPADPGGGLCLSCHTAAQTKAAQTPDGSTAVTAVDKSLWDASADGHNYFVQGTFASDGSLFQANCLKCHEDGRAKLAQNGSATFSLHDSLYAGLLSPLGSGFTPADPPTASFPNVQEEDFCFRCHGGSTAYASASGADVFGAGTLPPRALNLGAAFADAALPYRHPVLAHRGRHRPSTLNTAPGAPDDLTAANRHAECADCHNPHASRPGVHASPGNASSPALAGAWGVEPVWGAGTVPTSYTPGPVAREYQLCMKCHSSWVTGFGGADKGAEFSPNNASYHPVVAAGTNAAMPASLLAPWTSSSVMQCGDCHGNSNAGPNDPRGPHASAFEHILRGAYAAPGADMAVDSLCFRCHDVYTYTGQGSAPGGYTTQWTNFRHNNNNSNLHTSEAEHGRLGCAMCHRVHGAQNPHLIALYDAATNPEGRILSITDPGAGGYMKFHCTTRTTGCH